MVNFVGEAITISGLFVYNHFSRAPMTRCISFPDLHYWPRQAELLTGASLLLLMKSCSKPQSGKRLEGGNRVGIDVLTSPTYAIIQIIMYP